MTRFVDTSYFVALLAVNDQHHSAAVRALTEMRGELVTTDWILTELANYLRDPRYRPQFLALLWDLRQTPRVRIMPYSSELHERGLTLYASRLDKAWSLVDCVSFVVMQDLGLTEALTSDHHFEQAGFTVLLA